MSDTITLRNKQTGEVITWKKDIPTTIPKSKSPANKAIDIVGQFGKGAYENVPFGKRLAQMGDVAMEYYTGKTPTPTQDIYSSMPKPEGFTEQFASGLGQVAPDLAMSSPFMKGAGLIPKLPAIAKQALGFGTYGGTKAAIEGKPIANEALGYGGSAALFGVGGKVGSSLIPKALPFGERIGSAIGGGLTGAATGEESSMALGAGLGALYPSSRIRPNEQSTKVAEGLINYVLRPSKQLKKYANPASAVAKEGLWGRNIADLESKADIRLGELNDLKNNIKSDARNNNVTVDLAKHKVFQPIHDLMTELGKAPESNSNLINSITKNLNDIFSPSGKFRKLNNLSIDAAYEMRDLVNSLKPSLWKGSSSGEVRLANALRQTYHNIAEAINNSGISPELKTTNKRITDLIALKSAIEDASKANPSYWRILPFPIMVGYGIGGPLGVASGIGTLAAETIPGATTISKFISQKYPKLKP